jgi:hypothetical protein
MSSSSSLSSSSSPSSPSSSGLLFPGQQDKIQCEKQTSAKKQLKQEILTVFSSTPASCTLMLELFANLENELAGARNDVAPCVCGVGDRRRVVCHPNVEKVIRREIVKVYFALLDT